MLSQHHLGLRGISCYHLVIARCPHRIAVWRPSLDTFWAELMAWLRSPPTLQSSILLVITPCCCCCSDINTHQTSVQPSVTAVTTDNLSCTPLIDNYFFNVLWNSGFHNFSKLLAGLGSACMLGFVVPASLAMLIPRCAVQRNVRLRMVTTDRAFTQNLRV